MKTCFTIALLLCMLTGLSQSFNVSLSARHQKKISDIESGHKRMKKFYNYFKKDSARQFKQITKQERKSWDSTMRALRKHEKLEQRLAKHGVPFSATLQDSLSVQISMWSKVFYDSTISDSLKTIALYEIRDLTLKRAKQYPGFQHIEGKYAITGDSLSWEELAKQVPGIDTLKGLLQSSPSQLLEHSGKLVEEQLVRSSGLGSMPDEFKEIENLKDLPAQYKDGFESYLDKEKLMEEGKTKGVERAMDYFAENPAKLEAAQLKASKLLSKYKAFSNSTDLGDAKKHTSLEGKTLFERLVFGGTFNVISTQPFSVDLSPQLGYKFNTKFFAGIGMNYRMTFNDTIKHSWFISPSNTSFKAFISYDVIKSWYAYGEVEASGLQGVNNEKAIEKEWQFNYFVGAGRKFLIHPKLYMTLTALYNLNNEVQNPLYPRRFQVRVGFQVSELATRKKQVYYDPNR